MANCAEVRRMLNIKNLDAGYGGTRVLRGVSISVEDAEIVGIIGANGAGKTTLLKTLAGLLKPTSGELTYNNVNLNKLSPYELVELGISLVTEGGGGIFTNMSVIDNLYVASYSGRSRKQREELFKMVFELFPRIKERINQKAGTLSGGERKMLKIAMGLLTRPNLLMLDEPSQGLAPMLTAEVYEKIVEIHSRYNLGILLVEQNLYQSLDVAKRAYVLENGRIVLEGSSKTLLETPSVREKYLGIEQAS